jgi:Family of unknown function (DUF5706)
MNNRNKSRRASEQLAGPAAERVEGVTATSRGHLAGPGELDFLWKTGSYLNEQIRFADSKAGFAVALSTAIMGGFFGSGAQKLFTQSTAASWGFAGWLAVCAFVLLGGSVLLGVWTVHPRFPAHSQSQITFWGEILRYGSGDVFHEKLRSGLPDEVTRIVSQHVFALAEICRAKYAFLCACMIAGVLGGATAALVMLLRR